MSLIKPSKYRLSTIDMSTIMDAVHPEMKPFVLNEPGKDHYRLLRYIGETFQGTIYEIGTHRGASSTALSGGERRIITYDIQSWEKWTISTNDYRVKNPIDDIVEISTADLIFYDTSHDGVVEREFVAELKAHDFGGIVVFDDIHLNDAMKKFWSELTCASKEDWTDIGHWSGTGVAFFK